jgi:hypothetical protein
LLSQKLSAFPNAHGFELRELNRLVFAGLTSKYRSEIYSQRDRPSVLHELTWPADASAPDHLKLQSERLRVAYAYWEAKRDGRLMPSRSDIDPTDIPKLLPYVTLIEVLSPIPSIFAIGSSPHRCAA